MLLFLQGLGKDWKTVQNKLECEDDREDRDLPDDSDTEHSEADNNDER